MSKLKVPRCPSMVLRLKRLQLSDMCRFCLSKHQLVYIPDNRRIQVLLSECFGTLLGDLDGNSPKFICAGCYQRVEQSYEFLLLASRVQALMDTYTFHEGRWPRRQMLDEGCKTPEEEEDDGGKRLAEAASIDEERTFPVKRLRFSDSHETDSLSAVSVSSSDGTKSDELLQCVTPSDLWDRKKNGESVEGSASPGGESLAGNTSLPTTISGGFSSTEHLLDGRSDDGSSPAITPVDLDISLDDDFSDGSVAERKLSVVDMNKEDSAHKESPVQKLCVQITQIDVGEDQMSNELAMETSTNYSQ